jgi:pimeloyl-ACP methyl ester carboxylesterase
MVHALSDRASSESVAAPAVAAPAVAAPAVAAPAVAPAGGGEQMRARYPDVEGFVERDGVRIAYEVYGEGGPTLLFVPTWQIVHSRLWKAQIPYFARHGRVLTFDPRGNGKSDRPATSAAFDEREAAKNIIAVMDATSTDRATLVTLSLGAQRGLIVTAEHPDRVDGLVLLGPGLPIGERPRERSFSFDDVLDTDEGWAKNNIHYWRRDFDGYLQFFFSRCFTEPHSTKQIEDCVGWGHEIGAETLILGESAAGLTADETLELAARVRCPVLVVVGDEDAITGPGPGIALAAAVPGARLVTVEGGGHIPDARDPVQANLLIRDFVATIHPGFGHRVG